MQVTKETSALIEKGAIKSTIYSESPVYYDDGKTPIGVFFEQTHSKYIEYKDIPRVYIKALIASEDKDFFKHHGFDLRAIIRAFIVNFKAGKIIQGGSTITQQTAKNIFKREKKTYLVKLKELMQAMLLEKRYSKEEILEIYINQFFVTGFGKGLGVASEYFFDKEPKDLNLVEAAFLAGMVKGPYKYNPFAEKTEEEKTEAARLAKERKDYVLENMKSLNLITGDEYTKARNQEVPFKEGKVTYGLNVIMDYIRQQLESEYFTKILSEQGLDNIATSGINIYTSISQPIQEGALNSIRRHLSVLDVQLSGYDNRLNKERYMGKMGTILRDNVENIPFFCNISNINYDADNLYIEVKWDNGGEGIIDYEGLKPIGEAWLKWKNGGTVFDKKDALEFMKNFNVGDIIPVIYADKTGDPPQKQLLLWEIPELEGGVVVLNQGMIKAMVGGFFDRHFNRAADAKRQLGSIFKPLVYTAALQLKWNNLDSLTNIYNHYEFENTDYAPNPDHEPTSTAVSMAWAGAKSENLASVWLLYHLTDHLNMSEFKEVTEKVGLARYISETYQDYVKRIRDEHGIIVDDINILEAAFEEAKKDIETDLMFEGNDKALENLNNLHFDINSENMDSKIKEDTSISRFSFSRLIKMNSAIKNSGNAGSNAWVDGILPSSVINQLQSGMYKKFKELRSTERYDFNNLYSVRDFRTLVNLFYVRQLAEEMGVSSPLDAVLSFPLGSNSISILDSALAYNTIMNGKLSKVDEGKADNMIPVITRITDRNGELIWEYTPKPKVLLSDVTSGSITEILRMVVENGTGKRAKDAVKLSADFDGEVLDLTIPSFGKTGTSNQFSNSSFAGFIPGIRRGEFDLNNGYVISSYVGYDDNRPMKGRYTMIYGASGALPIWIDTANAVVNSMEYRKDIEVADLVFSIDNSRLAKSDALKPVKISTDTGLPLSGGQQADPDALEVYSNAEDNDGIISLKRVFEPLKGVESDDIQ